MRMMLKVSMDVEVTNQAIRNGSFQKIIEPVIDRLKAEACYFTAEHGKRTAIIFFQLADPSQIPQIAEPFFQTLGAEVNMMPVMNREDLAKGLRLLETQKAA